MSGVPIVNCHTAFFPVNATYRLPHRSAPPKDKRTQYALGIVTLFPSLKDPYSKKDYVSVYFEEKLTKFLNYDNTNIVVS